MTSDLTARIEQTGFTMFRAAFTREEIAAIRVDLETALRADTAAAEMIRHSRDLIYAARNLLNVWPRAIDLARSSAIRFAVTDLLGPHCGLVRGLYFDKPPGRSWSLPWHKDMTIAVRDNRLGGAGFSKPTVKAGVPHIEAPEAVLREMITARIHLDDVSGENGPLLVVPGSHREGKRTNREELNGSVIQSLHAAAGDVLLIRPLVTHSSGHSRPGTLLHRRIVHLEFASAMPLPDGYAWHEFHRLEGQEDKS